MPELSTDITVYGYLDEVRGPLPGSRPLTAPSFTPREKTWIQDYVEMKEAREARLRAAKVKHAHDTRIALAHLDKSLVPSLTEEERLVYDAEVAIGKRGNGFGGPPHGADPAVDAARKALFLTLAEQPPSDTRIYEAGRQLFGAIFEYDAWLRHESQRRKQEEREERQRMNGSGKKYEL